MSVMIVTASRHGATHEIGEAIARSLRAAGLEAHASSIATPHGFDGVDAVVLGSAVYAGRWLEDARRFVDEHAAQLRERPTWLFSSGPIGEPARPDDDKAVDVAAIVEATGAREHRVFTGRLDRGVLGLGERAVVFAFRAQDGDFRDWDAIASWGRSIAEALRSEAPPTAEVA